MQKGDSASGAGEARRAEHHRFALLERVVYGLALHRRECPANVAAVAVGQAGLLADRSDSNRPNVALELVEENSVAQVASS